MRSDLLLLLAGCTPAATLVCGAGTVEQDGACVPAEAADAELADTDEPADTDDPADDTGDAADDTGDAGDDTGDLPDDRTVDVYLLAGQSNMVGYGQRTSLPPSLRVAQDDVRIYWSGAPTWRGLQASSDLGASWFGPEVTFGRAIADGTPDRPVHLVKHAVGGTALHDYWYPGETTGDDAAGAGYKAWWRTVENAVAALEEEGHEPVFRGMIWMQGESDAIDAATAGQYEANLRHLIARVRQDTGVADLPFVAGQIDCRDLCLHRDAVNGAMAAVADEDPDVSTFSTEDLGRFPSDGWHYQGPGVRQMGERFAAALLGTEAPPMPTPALTVTGTYEYGYIGDYTLGWQFTLHEDVFVTDVGGFDFHGDGLWHGTTVRIWDADTSSVVAEGDIPGALEAYSPWIGAFVYAGIEPVLLPAGDYVIGMRTYQYEPDMYVYNAAVDVASALTLTHGRYVWSAGLDFPVEQFEITPAAASWLGPNFRYRPADD